MKINELKPVFMTYIPEQLEEGILYISEECWVAIHLCACGCGKKVVMPLDDEIGWILTKSDQGVTLRPSIGNFNFKCKSHYFITDNKVEWCN